MGAWLAVLAAPFAGSLMAALIRRLPRETPDLWGRSECETCAHRLSPIELVPIVSFLAQRGRCRACGARIAPQHLAVELAALAIALSALAAGARGQPLWDSCALGWLLLTLAWLDYDHYWLPDTLTLPLLVAGLVDAWATAPWDLADRALGAAVGYVALRGLAALYRRLRGREGIGQGDAKLLAAAGAWVGWPALPDLVLIAALLGVAAAGVVRLRGAKLHGASVLPFGTMLAAATWAVWLIQLWRIDD